MYRIEESETQPHLDRKTKCHPFKTRAELEADRKSAITDSYKKTKRLEESEAQVAVLRKQIGDLSRNLQEQQEFIFSLQPRREQITGTEAAAEFGSLCASIDEWVDTTLGDAIDDRRMLSE